jgi:phosphoserine phosphatase
MDSCVIQNECIDEIAKEANVSEQVSQITKLAMEKGLDFSEALKKRLALVQGLPHENLSSVWSRLSFTPGAVSLLKCLKSLGYVLKYINVSHIHLVLKQHYCQADSLTLPCVWQLS